MQFIILGCGDDHGVPRVGCGCKICRDALSAGNCNARTGPSVALRYGPSHAERLVLIDAAPEFRLQAARLGLQQFDAVLLTHAHDAHILGLSALANAQRALGHRLGIYAPADVLDNVQQRFDNLWTDKTYRRVLQIEALEDNRNLWDLQVRPMRIDHGLGGTAYGYFLTLGDLRLAYVSDMLRATAEARDALQDLDLLVLGTSHYYEGIEIWKRSVMDIMAGLELIRETSPKQAILSHLSHTVDYDEVSARLPAQVQLAYDGLTVEMYP
jgi:phosphoribosyl 1,2-cyclic phosphate phosphodiesterase